jgi:site-specific DNA recombinase
MNTLIQRHRPEACNSRQVPIKRLDDAVWEDLCQLLKEPNVLEEALRRAQEGWLDDSERMARRRDMRRRRLEVERRIQRLVDAYEAEVLSLEELQERRAKLEDRLVELQREEQRLAAESVREDQLRIVAARVEEFRAAVARGLDQADFAQRRALVELLIDRVVVDAPEVEIRYVIPISGAARRKGVLPSRHRSWITWVAC